MAPYVPQVRKVLTYPLYSADFDPLNPDFLLVGGGGGSTSSGVPNKITLIDTSRRDEELAEIADIELRRDEDSVTSLAVASSTDTALTAIAGINSSDQEQAAGKNEHLRSFRIALPRKRKADGSPVDEKPPRLTGTQPLGKSALFKSANGPKNNTYQRVLRASPIQSANQARVTVVASADAPENEVIAFQLVANALTSAVDEISRISLGKKEANDADVMALKEHGHILAYCTDNSVYVQKLPTSKGSRIESQVRVYQCPESADSTPTSQRPRFRALRLLTPKHILLLQNRPGRSGSTLLLLRLSENDGNGRVTFQKRLNKKTKSAVGLDVCALTESQSGQQQFIIAVASQDSSIEILIINYITFAGFSEFKPYTLLRDVHAGPITKLTFSNFIGPPLPVSKDTPPQSVRLASVGVDKTVVVHTLRLRPHPTTKTDKPSYVLIPPGASESFETTMAVLAAILVLAIGILCTQVFCEIRGVVPPALNSPAWFPAGMRDVIHSPWVNHTAVSQKASMESALSSAISAIVDAPSAIPLPSSPSQITESLASVVASNSLLSTPKAIVMRDTGSDVAAELHHEVDVVKEEALKKWEDLTAHEKKGWKQKMVDAGHWAEQQGESVLKGILFSEMAAFAAG